MFVLAIGDPDRQNRSEEAARCGPGRPTGWARCAGGCTAGCRRGGGVALEFAAFGRVGLGRALPSFPRNRCCVVCLFFSLVGWVGCAAQCTELACEGTRRRVACSGVGVFGTRERFEAKRPPPPASASHRPGRPGAAAADPTPSPGLGWPGAMRLGACGPAPGLLAAGRCCCANREKKTTPRTALVCSKHAGTGDGLSDRARASPHFGSGRQTWLGSHDGRACTRCCSLPQLRSLADSNSCPYRVCTQGTGPTHDQP